MVAPLISTPSARPGHAPSWRGGHHRSLYIIGNFGPLSRHKRPTTALSPQSPQAPMGNDSPGSSGRRGPFRLKFGSPVVPHRNLARSPAAPPASQSSAVANPIVVDPKHLSDLGQARRPAAPQLLSRSPPRASRAGFLPKVPAAQAVNFACRLKTRRNPLQTGGNRAQTGGKNSQNT